MCGECGKRFTTRKMSRHVFQVHRISDKTSNKCHLCDFGNVTIQELKAHLSSEHSLTPNKWNFYCSYPNCGQAFRFRTALEKHIGYWYQKKSLKKSLIPNIYGFPFQRTGLTLVNYRTNVNGQGVPPSSSEYRINNLGYNLKFSIPSKQWKLVEHVRQHTGEKPFKVWDTCPLKYSLIWIFWIPVPLAGMWAWVCRPGLLQKPRVVP